jgi:ligand-binding SRPBCC domain-containing protein
MKHLMPGLVLALLTFAIGITASTSWKACRRFINSSEAKQLTAKDEQAEYGSLKWHIHQVKARGEKEFVTGVLGCGMEVSTLNEALSNYSVVVAQLIEKRTYAEKHGLHTWYKFRVLETLSHRPLPHYSQWSSYVNPPSDLLPVGADELLMQGADGSMVIDEVTVIQRSNSPDYLPTKRYLLFVELDSSRRLATVPWPDEIGIFTVDADGKVKATDNLSYDLKDQMGKLFGNSVGRLKLYLDRNHISFKHE